MRGNRQLRGRRQRNGGYGRGRTKSHAQPVSDNEDEFESDGRTVERDGRIAVDLLNKKIQLRKLVDDMDKDDVDSYSYSDDEVPHSSVPPEKTSGHSKHQIRRKLSAPRTKFVKNQRNHKPRKDDTNIVEDEVFKIIRDLENEIAAKEDSLALSDDDRYSNCSSGNRSKESKMIEESVKDDKESGNYLTDKKVGGLMNHGPHSRILIVGDSRLQSVEKFWPEYPYVKPQFLIKPHLKLEELKEFILSHTDLPHLENGTFIVCCVGLHNIIKLTDYGDCTKIKDHEPIKVMSLIEEATNDVIRSVMGHLFKAYKALEDVLDKSSVICFCPIIPCDPIIHFDAQAKSHTPTDHTVMSDQLRDSLDSLKSKLTQVCKFINKYKVMHKICPVSSIRDIMSSYHVGRDIVGSVFDDGINLSAEASCLLAYELNRYFLEKYYQVKINSRFLEYKKTPDVLVVGDSRVMELQKVWLGGKPRFCCKPNLGFHNFTNFMKEKLIWMRNKIVIVCLGLNDLIEFVDSESCSGKNHEPCQFASSVCEKYSNTDEFMEKVLESFKSSFSLFCRTNSVLMFFATIYPIHLSYYMNAQAKVHKEKTGHVIILPAKDPTVNSKVNQLVNKLNSVIRKLNIEQGLPFWDMYDVVCRGNESSSMSPEVLKDGVYPSERTAEELNRSFFSFINGKLQQEFFENVKAYKYPLRTLPNCAGDTRKRISSARIYEMGDNVRKRSVNSSSRMSENDKNSSDANRQSSKREIHSDNCKDAINLGQVDGRKKTSYKASFREERSMYSKFDSSTSEASAKNISSSVSRRYSPDANYPHMSAHVKEKQRAFHSPKRYPLSEERRYDTPSPERFQYSEERKYPLLPCERQRHSEEKRYSPSLERHHHKEVMSYSHHQRSVERRYPYHRNSEEQRYPLPSPERHRYSEERNYPSPDRHRYSKERNYPLSSPERHRHMEERNYSFPSPERHRLSEERKYASPLRKRLRHSVDERQYPSPERRPCSKERYNISSPERHAHSGTRRYVYHSPERKHHSGISISPERLHVGPNSSERLHIRSRSPEKCRIQSRSPERFRIRSRSPERSHIQSRSPERSRIRSRSPERSYIQSRSPERSRIQSQSPERPHIMRRSLGRSHRSRSPVQQKKHRSPMHIERSLSPRHQMKSRRNRSLEKSPRTLESPERFHEDIDSHQDTKKLSPTETNSHLEAYRQSIKAIKKQCKKETDPLFKEALLSLCDAHTCECELYLGKPDAHPDYTKEYRLFLGKKKDFILNLGGDPATYDYGEEWEKAWPTRMFELFQESWEAKKSQCLSMISSKKKRAVSSSSPSRSSTPEMKRKQSKPNATKLAEYSSELRQKEGMDWDNSKWTQLPSQEDAKDNIQFSRTKSIRERLPEKIKEPNEIIGLKNNGRVVELLGILTYMKDKLGEFALPVNILYDKALGMERRGLDPNVLLEDEETSSLFNTLSSRLSSVVKDDDGPGIQRAILFEAHTLLRDVIDDMNLGRKKNIEEVSLNIGQIARLTMGKSITETIKIIKGFMVYEGYNNPSSEELENIYVSVRDEQLKHVESHDLSKSLSASSGSGKRQQKNISQKYSPQDELTEEFFVGQNSTTDKDAGFFKSTTFKAFTSRFESQMELDEEFFIGKKFLKPGDSLDNKRTAFGQKAMYIPHKHVIPPPAPLISGKDSSLFLQNSQRQSPAAGRKTSEPSLSIDYDLLKKCLTNVHTMNR